MDKYRTIINEKNVGNIIIVSKVGAGHVLLVFANGREIVLKNEVAISFWSYYYNTVAHNNDSVFGID